MIIRAAKESEKKEILALWQDCFHDPADYIDFYLCNRFVPETCAILVDDEEIIGMVHLLPCKISPDQKAFYWYAAGIKNSRRGEGLFRKLSEYIFEKTTEAGYNNVCVPAPGLEGFYHSIGLKYAYYAMDEEFSADFIDSENSDKGIDFNNIKITPAVAEDFILKNALGDTVWDRSAIQYAMKENQYCGGMALKIEHEQKQFSCFAIKKEDSFLIDYHNFSGEDFASIQKQLFCYLKSKRLILRTVGGNKLVGLTDSKLVDSYSKITMTLA